MDVTRSSLLSLLFVYFLPGTAIADIEYISPEKMKALESQFEMAEFNPSADNSKITDHKWTCDMFGARTNMQVQHDLKLYSLLLVDGQWRNKGAQLVETYQIEGKALAGVKDRFQDQVKITKSGLLVSRLSRKGDAKSVIAYSVCKTL